MSGNNTCVVTIPLRHATSSSSSRKHRHSTHRGRSSQHSRSSQRNYIRNKAPQSYWAKQIKKYDWAAHFFNSHFDEMAEFVAHVASGQNKVLEIGAGTGLVSERVYGRVRRLIVTDFDDGMLLVLRDRLPLNVKVKKADATNLSFKDNTFNAVIAANVLHLLDDPEKALDEVFRVLRKGGLFIAPTFLHGQKFSSRLLSWVMSLMGFPIQHRFSEQSYFTLFDRFPRFALQQGMCRIWDGKLPIGVVVVRKL